MDVRFVLVKTQTGEPLSWFSPDVRPATVPAGTEIIDAGKELNHETEVWNSATKRIELKPSVVMTFPTIKDEVQFLAALDKPTAAQVVRIQQLLLLKSYGL